MELGIGAAAGATDIAGQRAVLPAWRVQKERVIVPWAGRRHWAMGFSGSDAPVLVGHAVLIFFPKPIKSKSALRTSVRFGSSFLDNPGWYFRWFHRPGAGPRGFSPEESYPAQTSASCR